MMSAAESFFSDGSDNVNNRTLTVGYGGSAPVTDEVCIAFCGQGGYSYAGTEYSQQCCKLNFMPFCQDGAQRAIDQITDLKF
jgi:hypothetical protein